MYKVGLSSCGSIVGEEQFLANKKAGIEAMEISLGYENSNALDFRGLLSLAKQYDIKLWSYHLPFVPFSQIDISNKAVADDTVVYFEKLIQKGADIGIDKFVLHPSGEPIAPEDRADRMRTAKESLAKLADIAKRNGAVIAVEDLPRTCLGNCSDEMAELISVDPTLGVCFDTNHLLGEDPIDFIRKMGNRIVSLHVSDYDFVDERHWLPGEGKNDWHAIYQALQNVGYKGVWLYEVGFDAPKTMPRERRLTCEDFARNAQEIFEGRKLTVIPKQTHVNE